MGLICLSPPIAEPVSLPELKNMLRIDPTDTSQDSVIYSLSVAGRSWCESVLQRKLVQQTWRLYMDFFPGYIDLKLAGARVSTPFVSGSNAVLVGLRYAIALPYPPVQELVAFEYQNANGEVTSMIVGPIGISAVANPLNDPIVITTATPHGLVTGSTVSISGNSELLALINNPLQVITVIDPNDFSLNGTIGTGSAIPGGGFSTGQNFISDLQSQPARLTPIFGQMWPVARVVANAINVDYEVGFAVPVTTNITQDANATIASGNFPASAVGQPLSLYNATQYINTIILSVDGSGNATLRDSFPPGLASGLWVQFGNPPFWEMCKLGIKYYVNSCFVNRLPSLDEKTRGCIRAILEPARDLRL
jgi:hypothetical protein